MLRNIRLQGCKVSWLESARRSRTAGDTIESGETPGEISSAPQAVLTISQHTLPVAAVPLAARSMGMPLINR